MANVEWAKDEWTDLVSCFNSSTSIQEALGKFKKKHPKREYNSIRSKSRRMGQTFSEMLKSKSEKISSASLLKELKKYVNENKKLPDKDVFLETAGIEEWQIRKAFGGWSSFLIRASKDGFIPADIKKNADLVRENTKLKQENSGLQKTVKELAKESLTTESLKTLIQDLNAGIISHQFGSVAWLEEKPGKSTHGIPLLFLSDIHFDEVVDPAQIQFMNEYNRDIAIKRIQHTFNTTIRLLKKEIAKPNYGGFVLALGGDIFSGNIHEELAETNEASMFQSILILIDILIQGITLIKNEFGKVFIPCVTGNHGRTHKKMRFKNRAFDNYEWIMYQFLARHFKDDPAITFMIPDGPDAQFSIYDKTICLTHGDQFRGGSGISGIFTPLMLGMARKQKRNAAVNKSFGLMLLGHFHQLITTQSLIVNGCFPAGSEVLLEDGTRKDIASIAIGEKVLTHKGNIKEVFDVMVRMHAGRLMNLKLANGEVIKCTPNHKIWVSCKDISEKSCSAEEVTDAGWIAAEDIKNGSLFFDVVNNLYVKVLKVYDTIFVGDVYNISVKDDNSYTVSGFAVKNSIKGLDEYAFAANFPYEPPQQALVIFHPNKGITHMMSVLCSGYKKENEYKGAAIKTVF